MLNEKQHQVNKRCVRKAGFLLRNSAFLCNLTERTAVGCWVSLRFREHEAVREYHIPFTFTVFSDRAFNPTYGLYTPLVVASGRRSRSHSLFTRLISCSEKKTAWLARGGLISKERWAVPTLLIVWLEIALQLLRKVGAQGICHCASDRARKPRPYGKQSNSGKRY